MVKEREKLAAEAVFYRAPEGTNDRIDRARGREGKSSFLRYLVEDGLARHEAAQERAKVRAAKRR